jgi:hypothetical protein
MRSRWLPAVIAAVVFLSYLPGNIGCSDSMWSIPTAVSLLDHGDANLDEYGPILEAHGYVLTQRVGGHVYTIYPLGASIVAIPGIIVLRPLAAALLRHAPAAWATLQRTAEERGCRPVAGEPVIELHSWTEHLIASAIVAAAAAVMFIIAADELSAVGAMLLAFIFAFGTPAWSTASRVLWQHGPSMLVVAVVLLLQRRGGRPIWIGLLLAFAVVVRPTNAILCVAAGAWLLATKPRALPEFVAGAAIVLVPFAIANRVAYAAWLPPYYRPGFYRPNPFFFEALAGLLVSPNRGLFVFSPIFVLSIAGFALLVVHRRLTALDVSLAASVAAIWVVLAKANFLWWGGHSYGPRFFADVLPYLTVFLIPIGSRIEATRGPRRIPLAAVVVTLSAVSVAMHAQGALNASTVAWNGLPMNIDSDPVRVWDWRRPQFLAGLTFVPSPPPPVDLDALTCTSSPGVAGAPTVAANDGGTVTLKWSRAAGPVAVYIAQIGGRPGVYDALSREARNVLEPSLTVKRVPAGTYYVRVFARNRCGDGPPSPETAVVVP